MKQNAKITGTIGGNPIIFLITEIPPAVSIRTSMLNILIPAHCTKYKTANMTNHLSTSLAKISIFMIDILEMYLIHSKNEGNRI